jgi:hypothetical protein
MLVVGVLLTACSGKSSATIPQGAAEATLERPNDAESALLAGLHGMVEVKTADGQWTVAQAGQTLQSGQQIRTLSLSNATMTFSDNGRIYLGANTEIALDMLETSDSGARNVQLTQASGESRHELAESDNLESRYDVNTPAGSGSAVDAKFTVITLPNQLSQFWVDEGVVFVTNANSAIPVVAGQTSMSLVGQPPTEPAFRVSGEGQVLQIRIASNETSPVGQIGAANENTPPNAPLAQGNQNDKITLCHATGSATNPYVEITVAAAGVANGHARHAGDIIPAPAEGCPTSLPPTPLTIWNIGGQIFHTTASTIILGNPQPGDWVRFEGYQQADGVLFANLIVLISHTYENQFEFIGQVENIDATTWTVSGRVVQVNEMTTIATGLVVGNYVQVTGSITADGRFWATSVSRMAITDAHFRFVGILTNINGNVWTISGIKVAVNENTVLNGEFVVGHPVSVIGIIEEDGTWLALSIDLVTMEGYRFDFIGPVQSMNPWVVSGIGFDTAEWTEIDTGIDVGNRARVTGVVSADGIWVAERIERLDTEQLTRFNFFGPVISINPWNVRGVLLTVDERTTIKREITLGEMVKVTGWILTDGSWLATEIKHTGLHLGQGCFLISSVVQSMNDGQIVLINGQTIALSDDLELVGDLREGSLVRYQLCVDAAGVSKIWRISVVSQDQLPTTDGSGGKVIICHAPPGNPNNRHTIEVGQSAVSAHLGHGDTLGACPNE